MATDFWCGVEWGGWKAVGWDGVWWAGVCDLPFLIYSERIKKGEVISISPKISIKLAFDP